MRIALNLVFEPGRCQKCVQHLIFTRFECFDVANQFCDCLDMFGSHMRSESLGHVLCKALVPNSCGVGAHERSHGDLLDRRVRSRCQLADMVRSWLAGCSDGDAT